MQGGNWEVIGQALGIIALVVTAAYGIVRGHKKSDGAAPVDRAPPQNEVKAALESLRAGVDRHAETIGDDITDIRRQLDRLERCMERLENRAHLDALIRERTIPPTFGG